MVGSQRALPIASLCRPYLGTWHHPSSVCSRLGRCIGRSPQCCGSGKHRAVDSGSTHQCLWRSAEISSGQALSEVPPVPPMISPGESLLYSSDPAQEASYHHRSSWDQAQSLKVHVHLKLPMIFGRIPPPQGSPYVRSKGRIWRNELMISWIPK